MPLLSPIWLSRQEGATELYLIRHGDVLSGSDHLMPGGTYDDQPLSSLGQQQAQALATHLETLRFAAIYSSASRRARETAKVLANYHGLPVTIEPDIHEMHVAILEQRLPDDVSPTEHAALLREQLGTVIRAVGDAGQWSDVSAAESRAIYHARVVTALDALAARHTGGAYCHLRPWRHHQHLSGDRYRRGAKLLLPHRQYISQHCARQRRTADARCNERHLPSPQRGIARCF